MQIIIWLAPLIKHDISVTVVGDTQVDNAGVGLGCGEGRVITMVIRMETDNNCAISATYSVFIAKGTEEQGCCKLIL